MALWQNESEEPNVPSQILQFAEDLELCAPSSLEQGKRQTTLTPRRGVEVILRVPPIRLAR